MPMPQSSSRSWPRLRPLEFAAEPEPELVLVPALPPVLVQLVWLVGVAGGPSMKLAPAGDVPRAADAARENGDGCAAAVDDDDEM